jgi:tetratricopeptide (TPR) repeat protein
LTLEEERDFCLRSLRDLDAERDAGDLDADDYVALRHSYVARAAVALRGLEAETVREADRTGPAVESGTVDREERLEPPGDSAGRRRVWRPRRRAVLAALGVAVVAGVASWSVVASSGTRLPGQEITGQALGTEAEAGTLQQAQQATDRGDSVAAMKDYEKVLKADPAQPQALTGAGWLLAQTGQPALLQQGLTMFASAERANAGYAPAHVYRGIALLSEDDYSDAIPELQWYLAHNPDPQLTGRVRQLLQQAQAKAAAAAKAGG